MRFSPCQLLRGSSFSSGAGGESSPSCNHKVLGVRQRKGYPLILLHSREREYVVITEDMDFSALLALSGYGRPSVVSLRLSFSDPESVADRLIHVLPLCETSLAEGCVVSVSDEAIRMRRLPIG